MPFNLCICFTISTAFFSIKASSERTSSFFVQQFKSVLARMWEIVPNLEKNAFDSLLFEIVCGYLWNSMAMNWMTTMAKKKNTRTIPIGSRCKYSLVTMIWGRVNS